VNHLAIILSKERLSKARDYLMTKGRKLERELFKYHFEDCPSESVILELSKYQGEKGGFRNLGEGDRNKENAMDTNMAFHILHEINASSSETIVQKGIEFIINSYDHELKYWHPNPTSTPVPVQSYMLNDKWANPCADFIGYLCDYKELVSNDFLMEVTEVAMEKLPLLNKDGWFATLCYLRLADRLEEPNKDRILSKVRQIILEIIETRQEVWSTEYCAKPFWYAPSPSNALFPLIKQHVIKCLENEINHQDNDGNFILNWDAGSGENEWKSICTVNILKSRFEKAKEFIKSSARGLERSRWEFEFENGSKESVLLQLKTYQNEDGGFGNGIEPDFWLPHSSPMATWAAGQFLMEIGVDKNEPMINSMISYLVHTNHIETGMWDSALPENNEFPHAPWWHWQEGVQENWMFNPSAELAAYLVNWSSEQSKGVEIGWNSIEKAVNHLMNKSEMDKHEINNYQQLIEIMKLHESTFEAKLQYSLESVTEKIMTLAERCVDKDVSTWTEGYKPLPLDFIDNPDHPLCKRFGPLVEKNLNLYIEQMSEDGIWDISWSWGSYPEHFKVAKRYWKGILAVNRYKQLKVFGYLE
jgi:hypothetical protein